MLFFVENDYHSSTKLHVWFLQQRVVELATNLSLSMDIRLPEQLLLILQHLQLLLYKINVEYTRIDIIS